MPSNADLQAEVERLSAENDELMADVDRLEHERDQALTNQVPKPNTKPKAEEPSFGLSEGQRAELEMHGKTVSPFTGKRQVGEVDDSGHVTELHEASAEEFDKIPGNH